MTDNANTECQDILKILHKSGQDNMVKVLWSAMHILKVSPDMTIKEAMEYGYNDWIKGEKK